MEYASKRWNRMVQWCEKNPAEVYADYRDELPEHMAQYILEGEFDKFWQEAWELEFSASDCPGFWDYWEDEFAREFGYDNFHDMPEQVKEIAYENKWVDSRDYIRTACRNTRVNVNAILQKRDGELIYAPLPGASDSEEYGRARYIRDAFAVNATPTQVSNSLEVIYGGYDMECAVLCGTVDLWEILQSGKKPEFVTIYPQDSDNLLWYEFFNGAGNMGGIKIGKPRKFRATFHVDGARGYGIDSCYGFCGSFWQNELDVA